MKHIFLLLTLFCCLTANAQQVFDNMTIEYKNAKKVMCIKSSDNVSVLVAIPDNGKLDKHLELDVVVANNGETNFNVNPSNFSIEEINKGKSSQCGVYTCDEWVKKEKTRILLWGPNNVEQQTVKTNVTTGSGTQTTTSTIETKVDVRTNANDEARADAESSIRSKYLTRTTVRANDIVYGMVVAKNKKAQNLIITIPINGNKYVFDLSRE